MSHLYGYTRRSRCSRLCECLGYHYHILFSHRFQPSDDRNFIPLYITTDSFARVFSIIQAHSFCYDCIIKWSKQENSCPLCKKEFNFVDKVPKVKPMGRMLLPAARLHTFISSFIEMESNVLHKKYYTRRMLLRVNAK